MKHPFRWVTLGVGALVALFAIVLAVNVDTDPRADLNNSRLVGRPAPAFTLTRFDGTPVRSADLVGKTVLLNFWNSWCQPCEEEYPALRQWYAAHRDDPDVVLLGIPRDDTAAAIRAEADDLEMAWAVAEDRGARAATIAFGTRGQPESFVISPSGMVVGSLYGPATVPILDRMVAAGQEAG
jgi:cytochrome c biogenesis protein CcmG/thiol:disulfide interchange protein DsbE